MQNAAVLKQVSVFAATPTIPNGSGGHYALGHLLWQETTEEDAEQVFSDEIAELVLALDDGEKIGLARSTREQLEQQSFVRSQLLEHMYPDIAGIIVQVTSS